MDQIPFFTPIIRWINRNFKLLLITFTCLLITTAALLSGYYSHKMEIYPVHDLIFRVERKINKIMGEPTLTQRLTQKIETTFIQLRGRVFEMPDNDYISGGALTVWGDDLVLINHLGDIYYLDQDRGLLCTEIASPKNGLEDLINISMTEKYKDYTHKPGTMRFNDIEFIKYGNLHGISVSYTFFDITRECYGTRISWLSIAEGDNDVRELSAKAGDWETIFETKPCLQLNPGWTALDGIMAGGRTAFAAPSTLYLGSGEYHLDGIHTYDVGIQSNETSYGKVIAIDLLSRENRIVSKGHRNLQGIAIDNRGRLWTTEHGIRGGDELNLIKEGANYGWPLETLGTLYNGQPVPGQVPYGRHETYKSPVYAWLPSAAISSLTSISGLDESWDGDLLAGSLSSTEFGASLFHIRVRDERVVFVERIKLGRRVRHLIQFGKDKIAVWLDSNELVLFEVARRGDPLSKLKRLIVENYDEATAKRVIQILGSCNECHSYEQFENRRAPSLSGVVGRNIASTDYDGYSNALTSVPGWWDQQSLHQYLTDPGQFAPGTTMPATGLTNKALLDAVIWSLEKTNTLNQHMTYN